MSTKSKRKSYYLSGNPQKKFKGVLSPGMKGFICTCNKRTKECIKEAYCLLEDYAEKLSPKKEEDKDKGEFVDLQKELEKEIEELKTKTFDTKSFQVVDTGAVSCVFIKTTYENPLEIAEAIMNDIKQKKQVKSRSLLRMIPVEVTCKAYLDEIKKTADKLFDVHFRCEPTTFSVVYSKRYNNSVLRDEIINSLALLVRDKNIGHKVDLKHSKKTIIVEIVKAVCCLSVVTDFFEYKKFNLLQLGLPEKVNEEFHLTPAN